MASLLISEWLSEYKTLSPHEMHTYANTVRNNEDLITSLYTLLEGTFLQEIVDPVCHQLFEFYRTGIKELQRFTLELVPTLIEAYLIHVSQNAKRKCGGIEICLLGIYNLEIVNKDGSPKCQSFTIPTLAHPSIYHEPPSLATLALTESALLRYHSDDPVVIATGPMPQYERLNAQNRFCVLSHILTLYSSDIVSLGPTSRRKLCKMASRIAKTGFEDLDRLDCGTLHLNDFKGLPSSQPSKKGVKFMKEPRITLTPTFLVELLNGIYFVMFNGHAKEAINALEDIHKRASYELLSDVLLVTNAIRNSLTNNPSGQPGDGPIGISVVLSPTTSNPGFAKSAITNASFRAKKLPEDIDCRDDEEEAGPSPPNYDEVIETEKVSVEEKMKAMGTKMAKPLKSIMKKAEKGRGRDSEKKRDSSDGNSSPRHSLVMQSSTSANGDIADPGLVTVSVARSSSRTVVDHIELQSPGSDSQHKRTSSYTDPPPYSYPEENEDATEKPLLPSANHSHDIRVTTVNGDNSSASSNGSLNTQL